MAAGLATFLSTTGSNQGTITISRPVLVSATVNLQGHGVVCFDTGAQQRCPPSSNQPSSNKSQGTPTSLPPHQATSTSWPSRAGSVTLRGRFFTSLAPATTHE